MIDVKKEQETYKTYLVLRNYQPSTVKMYMRTLGIFLSFCNDRFGGHQPTQEYAQQYLLMRIEKGRAWSTINADYSALRKYYKVVKQYPWSLKKLPRPKKEKRLPAIISKEEVGRLIEAAPNLKHQVFLTFLYATGVRLSEATHVKIQDIDSERMQIHIHRGKGAKDRKVVLCEKLLDLLRIYFRIYRPKEYLFNGQVAGSPYSCGAGQWAIRRGRELAGITRKCSIHTLRNCYATHHLELGTDLVFLQEQLGHKYLKTTAKYIRLCIERYRQINHPIDMLEIKYRDKTTLGRSRVYTVKNISKPTSRP
jgi:integrase/recombinase XerD